MEKSVYEIAGEPGIVFVLAFIIFSFVFKLKPITTLVLSVILGGVVWFVRQQTKK
ncbi:MAG: hypothetical protein Q7S33_02160 [Nanoarchaeota archaeon]|nr:hypothetical protein [Nanoarchaeota archaeon]